MTQSVDELLASARARIERLTAREASDAVATEGAVLVDTRYAALP